MIVAIKEMQIILRYFRKMKLKMINQLKNPVGLMKIMGTQNLMNLKK